LAIFSPSPPHPRQGARTARSVGARALVLTAKHHDGFCLWPTRTTTHSVARSPWRAGGGDLAREFVAAPHAGAVARVCPRRVPLRVRAGAWGRGLFLPRGARNNRVYGDSPRYNDLYCDQLT